MTERIIDNFEPVKIQVKNPAQALLSFRHRLGLTEPVGKKESIWQTGKLIMVGHEVKLFLRLFAGRDIPADHPDSSGLVILEAAGHCAFNINPLATF